MSKKLIVLDEPTRKFLGLLSSFRLKAGLTQKELGEELCLSESTVQNYERGTTLPYLHNLMKLADYFGYDLSSSVNYKNYHGLSELRVSSRVEEFSGEGYKSRKRIALDGPTKEFLTSLRALREAAGLTQAELSDAVGISRGAIDDYESGITHPILGNLIKLADYFGYDLSESVNYKYYYGKLTPKHIRRKLREYGLSYTELSEILEYHLQHIFHSVKNRYGGSLTCLEAVLSVVSRERERSRSRGR